MLLAKLSRAAIIGKLCERYYNAVLLTIGIKKFTEKNTNLKLIFISSETKLKDPLSNQLVGTPDILLRYNHISEGLVIELKISAPSNPTKYTFWLDNTIKQLQKYDKDLLGWDTSSGQIQNHSIILLVHYEDSKKVKSSIKNEISLKKLNFQHTLSYWEWVLETSQKFGKKDVITIRDLDEGAIGHELGEYLKNNDIPIILEEINTDYDLQKFQFIRQKPTHIFYVIEILYAIIFPVFGWDESDSLIIGTEEIMSIAENYLPAWLPESGQNSQLKISWVNEALDTLVVIKQAKKIGNKYNVHLPRNNDIRKYLLEKLSIHDITTGKYNDIRPQGNRKDRSLFDFK